MDHRMLATSNPAAATAFAVQGRTLSSFNTSMPLITSALERRYTQSRGEERQDETGSHRQDYVSDTLGGMDMLMLAKVPNSTSRVVTVIHARGCKR